MRNGHGGGILFMSELSQAPKRSRHFDEWLSTVIGTPIRPHQDHNAMNQSNMKKIERDRHTK
jgi:hypothetical protein